MTAAARFDDPIQHSNALRGLLTGALIGAGVGLFVVATGGLGAGLVAAAIIGGGAATGAGVLEVLGSTSWAGGSITGGIASGSSNTTVNSLKAARATLDWVHCSGTPPGFLCPSHEGKRIAQGSATVFVNSQPAARVDDKIECGSKIKKGSSNVIIGGPTAQTLDIDSEVPGYIHGIVAVVGIASAVILAGPVVAVCGTLGSMGGGTLAQWGAAQLGLSEDWQKIAGLGGSMIGGWGGGKFGGWANTKAPIANFESGMMRPVLEKFPGYRNDIAAMKGASPTQTEAREQIANGQTPGTQAAQAANWQGNPRYPGKDPMQNTTMQPGERYYAGVGKNGQPSGYFVSEKTYNDFISNGGTREEFWQGVQVEPGGAKYATPGNPYGYRDQLGIFEVQNPIDAAVGPTVANPQYGAGGMEQYFSTNGPGNMTQVGTVMLPASATPTFKPYSGPGGLVGAGQGAANAPLIVNSGSHAKQSQGSP